MINDGLHFQARKNPKHACAFAGIWTTGGDLGLQKCGIVTFTMDQWSPQEIRRKLAEWKMNVHVSSAESTRLDMDERGFASVVRALVHYYNTEEEIARFCDFITSMI